MPDAFHVRFILPSVSSPMNAVLSTDWCVLQGDHVDAGSPEKEEGSKSRNGGLLEKPTKHVMSIRAVDKKQHKKTEALRPKLKLMLLLLRR